MTYRHIHNTKKNKLKKGLQNKKWVTQLPLGEDTDCVLPGLLITSPPACLCPLPGSTYTYSGSFRSSPKTLIKILNYSPCNLFGVCFIVPQFFFNHPMKQNGNNEKCLAVSNSNLLPNLRWNSTGYVEVRPGVLWHVSTTALGFC